MKNFAIKAGLVILAAVVLAGAWHYTVERRVRLRMIAERAEFVKDSVAAVISTMNDSIAVEAERRRVLEARADSLEARQIQDSIRAAAAGRRARSAERNLERHLEEEGDSAGVAGLATLRQEHAEEVEALESRADSLVSLVFVERERAETFRRERDAERQKFAALERANAALEDQVAALEGELNPSFGARLVGKLDDVLIAGAAFFIGTQVGK